MSFIAGVNRIGVDGYNLDYKGDSHLFDTLGEDVVQLNNHPEILQFEIDKEQQDKTRTHFNFLNDRDLFHFI